MRFRIIENLLPRAVQQRAQEIGGRHAPAKQGLLRLAQERHGACATHSSPAQQLQQQGLRLIVGVVRERHKIAGLAGKCRMAQLARRRFDSVRAQRRNIHALDVQGNKVSRAKIGAKVYPLIGVWADTVMDMQRGKLPGKAGSELVQQMQQYH